MDKMFSDRIPGKRICGKKKPRYPGAFSSASGGRTHTMSPSTDFKSVASADSAIAPHIIKYIPGAEKVKLFGPFMTPWSDFHPFLYARI